MNHTCLHSVLEAARLVAHSKQTSAFTLVATRRVNPGSYAIIVPIHVQTGLEANPCIIS